MFISRTFDSISRVLNFDGAIRSNVVDATAMANGLNLRVTMVGGDEEVSQHRQALRNSHTNVRLRNA